MAGSREQDEHRSSEETGERPARSGPAQVVRLRDRIDRGGAADKVAFSDPAAAPLGTDDEAAGTPPTAERAAMATAAEAGRASEAERKKRPAELQRRQFRPWMVVVAALLLLLLAGLLIAGIS